MRPRAWGMLATTALGCTGAPPPARLASAPPDVVVVAFEDQPALPAAPLPGGTVLLGGMPVHPQARTAWAALLAGQWPGTVSASPPNTLQGVLQLYGYATHAHLSPTLAATAADAPWLTAGLAPLPGPCPQDSLAAALALAPPAPDGATLSVIAVPADDPACPGARAAVLGLLPRVATAQPVADGAPPHPRHLVVAGLNDPAADLLQGEPRAPLAFHGPGWRAARIHGQATVVDVLPTVLALAKAVAPSDADGVDLTQTWSLGKAALAPVLFVQDAENNLMVRTSLHRMVVPAAARPLSAGAPPAVPLQATALDGSDAGPAVRDTLVQTAQAWERSLTGRTASERAGASALRAMLAEQGYWK